MWNKTQKAAFERALAATGKLCPACDALAQIAQYAPEFRERMDELKTRTDNLKGLSELALSFKELP